jgi:hypothetical protein
MEANCYDNHPSLLFLSWLFLSPCTHIVTCFFASDAFAARNMLKYWKKTAVGYEPFM